MGTGEEAQRFGGAEEDIEDQEAGGGVVASLVGKARGFVAEKIAQIPRPEASLDRVAFQSVSREGITLHSHIDISNPYANRIPICELTYTFKSDGK